MSDPRYPIGRFQPPAGPLTADERRRAIEEIERTPAMLRAAVEGLTDEQLDTPYRPEGWTIRQVVHHLPDSHLNSFIRFKLALTEEQPTIKPYDEEEWAKLEDARSTPIAVSVALLEALHARWVVLLRSMTAADFARTFNHPEQGTVSLDRTLALYAWHGPHHVAQVAAMREREGWG